MFGDTEHLTDTDIHNYINHNNNVLVLNHLKFFPLNVNKQRLEQLNKKVANDNIDVDVEDASDSVVSDILEMFT